RPKPYYKHKAVLVLDQIIIIFQFVFFFFFHKKEKRKKEKESSENEIEIANPLIHDVIMDGSTPSLTNISVIIIKETSMFHVTFIHLDLHILERLLLLLALLDLLRTRMRPHVVLLLHHIRIHIHNNIPPRRPKQLRPDQVTEIRINGGELDLLKGHSFPARDPILPVVVPVMHVPLHLVLRPRHVHVLPHHRLRHSIQIVLPPSAILENILHALPDLDAVVLLEIAGHGGHADADDHHPPVGEEAVE
ncbi:hypothetical protein TorRG33x02_154550, partial [Trema orientale]